MDVCFCLQLQSPFVHFLLATSFASHAELGYDPTFRRNVIHDAIVYEYMVHDEAKGRDVWYRTVGDVLFNTRAYRLMGRAIRVWKVVELDVNEEPFGEEMVLKDYWITEDSKTEGQIQEEIFKAADKELGKDNDPANFKKYFMSIRHDTIVKMKAGADTTGLHLHCDGKLNVPYTEHPLRLSSLAKPTPPQIKDSCHASIRGSRPVTSPDAGKHDTPKGAPQPFEPRKHARLVFQEVGIPLYQVMDHKILFGCLHDATQGRYFAILSTSSADFLQV